MAIYTRDTATSFCATITGVSGTGGDTLTESPSEAHYQGYACVVIYSIFVPTTNATYVVTIQGGALSPANFNYVLLKFTKGSLLGTADGTCTNNSAGAQALACLAAISPTGTIELAIGVAAQYDNLQGSEAIASPFTIPTNGKFGVGATGALVLGYYVGNPPAATVTPTFTNLGLGDPLAVRGAAWK